MDCRPVNFGQKFGLLREPWQPRVVAELNDHQFKVVRLEGDFAVRIGPGGMFVVPRGIEHKPYAEREVKMLLIEPCGVPNTGDQGGERTARNDVWI